MKFALGVFPEFRRGIEEEYEEEGVAAYLKSANEIFKPIDGETTETYDKHNVDLKLRYPLLQRVKQYLLLYHYNRLEGLASASLVEHKNKLLGFRLSRVEAKFAASYRKNLLKYTASFRGSGQVKIQGPCTPPKSLLIQIRAIKDCGQIETEGGSLYLAANSLYFVKKSDVQSLIDNGSVIEIK